MLEKEVKQKCLSATAEKKKEIENLKKCLYNTAYCEWLRGRMTLRIMQQLASKLVNT
jgi:hypothetical protein